MADASEHDHTFESADAGSATTFPLQCSALRKNGHVVIKGRPCKIIDMSTSKTGKHGHAKVNLVATDIFTGRKYEDLSPSTHNMNVPIISRLEYALVNIEMNMDDDVKGRGFLSLMREDGTMKEDVRVPDNEEGDKIIADFESGLELMVTVISAMGEEHAMSYKEAPKGNN
ncbi:translation initiation factor eIF5A [Coemansia sp. RSA 2131]|nr:translation initiation factor eIF5A [Coemansia sp. RSA 2131]